MDTKTCTKCGAVKTLDEFYNQRDGRFGKTSRCGECMTAHLICNIRKQDKPLEQCGHLWMRN